MNDGKAQRMVECGAAVGAGVGPEGSLGASKKGGGGGGARRGPGGGRRIRREEINEGPGAQGALLQYVVRAGLDGGVMVTGG